MNAEGRVCVEICVVARADEPFTDGPMVGRREILAWLDTWDVSRSWPAGPRALSQSHAALRSRRLWARGGHFGASQVPGLTATGPGAIDPERLTGRAGQGRPPGGGRGRRPRRRPAARRARSRGRARGWRATRCRYDPPDLGELLGTRSASLSRVH